MGSHLKKMQQKHNYSIMMWYYSRLCEVVYPLHTLWHPKASQAHEYARVRILKNIRNEFLEVPYEKTSQRLHTKTDLLNCILEALHYYELIYKNPEYPHAPNLDLMNDLEYLKTYPMM
jgi:hypothetical protein